MKSIKVILNPVAGRGISARAKFDIEKIFREENLDFDLVCTEGYLHAAKLAEQAKKDGFEIVVAVGGDGTCNEVINGLIAASKNDCRFAILCAISALPLFCSL